MYIAVVKHLCIYIMAAIKKIFHFPKYKYFCDIKNDDCTYTSLYFSTCVDSKYNESVPSVQRPFVS